MLILCKYYSAFQHAMLYNNDMHVVIVFSTVIVVITAV